MNTAILIPARLASTRFPEKMLQALNGKALIKHVYDVCRNTGFDTIVLTDSKKIASIIPEAVKPAPFDNIDGVSKSGDNYLTVQYEKIVPLLIECIKDQQRMIENLQGQIDEIKTKII